MPIPDFLGTNSLSVDELRLLLSDRIRIERRRTDESQRVFAERCGIPLRTYKRFEQGRCDSLEVFFRIVIAFDRIKGFELMFPPKPVRLIPRTAPALLEQVRRRAETPKP